MNKNKISIQTLRILYKTAAYDSIVIYHFRDDADEESPKVGYTIQIEFCPPKLTINLLIEWGFAGNLPKKKEKENKNWPEISSLRIHRPGNPIDSSCRFSTSSDNIWPIPVPATRKPATKKDRGQFPLSGTRMKLLFISAEAGATKFSRVRPAH